MTVNKEQLAAKVLRQRSVSVCAAQTLVLRITPRERSWQNRKALMNLPGQYNPVGSQSTHGLVCACHPTKFTATFAAAQGTRI